MLQRLSSGLFLAALLSAHLHGQGLPPVPVPAGNPITTAKANLGKVLFWEEQLSSTGTVACGTCHVPGSGGSDPRSPVDPGAIAPGPDGLLGTPDDVHGSPGIVRALASGNYDEDETFGLRPQVTGRKAPSMINAAFAPLLFWDGRATGLFSDPVTGTPVLGAGAALESQSVAPPVNTVEMGHEGITWSEVAARLESADPLALAASIPLVLEAWIAGRDYPALFAEAFGTPEVTAARVALALATYERTLIADQSPFDAGTLTAQQQRGRNIFNGPGRCVICHGGPLFTDQAFHNVGVTPAPADPGRFAITGNPADRGRFKTPGLRNVALRAPYFHDGSKPTLDAVVAFYNRGGDFPFNQDPAIVPLGLGPPQRADLVAFLNALTDPRVAAELPPFDRPTLYSESPRVPQPYGVATPGSGGLAPIQVALEPPRLGNPSWTLALDNGRGGAAAFLFVDTAADLAGTNVAGATIHLARSGALTRLFSTALAGSGPGEGWASLSLAVPGDPGLVGLDVYLQWLVLDPGAAGPVAATAGLHATLF
jgi:cytochrome c peroxidase